MAGDNIIVRILLPLIICIILFTGCGEEKKVCLGFQPIVSLITPTKGGIKGGDSVTVKGVNFCPDPEVRFGGNLASNVQYIGRTEISAVTPPANETGPVDVTVTNADGLGNTLQSGFTYSPD
ncbi:MAG: IPT/TIG domain-containing protein [Nitrospirota bacterium]